MNSLLLLNILFMIVCLVDYQSNYKKGSILFWVLSLLIITIRGLLIPDSVFDMDFYTKVFETSRSNNALQSVMVRTEPGYAALNIIVSKLGFNFSGFLVLYNIFLAISYYVFIRRFSYNAPLAFCFFILIMSNQSVYVLRQHLAIAVVLFSYPYIINKKLIYFLLICAIATLIHSSAIIWLPIYFIYNVENEKRFFGVLIGAILLFFLGFQSIDTVAIDINEKYMQYIEESETSTISNFLIQFIILVSSYLFMKGHIMDNKINKLLFVAVGIGAVIDLAGINIRLASRLAHYYTVADIVLLANTIKYIKVQPLKAAYLSISLSLFFIIFLANYGKGKGLEKFDYNIHSIFASN